MQSGSKGNGMGRRGRLRARLELGEQEFHAALLWPLVEGPELEVASDGVDDVAVPRALLPNVELHTPSQGQQPGVLGGARKLPATSALLRRGPARW